MAPSSLLPQLHLLPQETLGVSAGMYRAGRVAAHFRVDCPFPSPPMTDLAALNVTRRLPRHRRSQLQCECSTQVNRDELSCLSAAYGKARSVRPAHARTHISAALYRLSVQVLINAFPGQVESGAKVGGSNRRESHLLGTSHYSVGVKCFGSRATSSVTNSTKRIASCSNCRVVEPRFLSRFSLALRITARHMSGTVSIAQP